MKKINQQKGYTIIETMIAVSLFLIVAVVGIGTLLSAHVVHQKARDMRSIMDNLSFIMEDMSRNLRTGYNYHCGSAGDIQQGDSCDSDFDSIIYFEEGKATASPAVPSDQWGYKIELGNIYKSTNGGVPPWLQLNPDEVILDPDSGFSVKGAEVGGPLQPFVTIKLVGRIEYKDTNTPFSLQTSVSQRLIDR